MESLLEIFQYPWAIRALIASSMVGVMCGVLGCFIVLRNMAMIGDALAHAILPGIVFAFIIFGYSVLGFFMGAVVAGFVTAVGITWIQQNVGTKSDAAIGIVFTAMFSIGVMAISGINREGVHLDMEDFLFGNILGISDQDLYLTGFITFYVLASIIIFYRYLFITTFQPVIAETMGVSVKTLHYFLMLLLSFAVVAALRTVGVILVVAMLITPASTALLLSNRLNKVVFISALMGLLAAVTGLVIAIQFDTTPGPAMAVTSTAFYLIAVIASPEKGLVVRYFRKRKLRLRIQMEDTLKQAFRLQEKGQITLDDLASRLGFGKSQLRRHLATLKGKGWMDVQVDMISLSESGQNQAKRLVRAHRLWETYLVDKIGLSEEQIHEEAEKYEHLLTDDLLDEVDQTLGYPKIDPHGSPIPDKQ
ncbi:MAG: iron chelate uptake ABC transporter family permease subunit [Bacteroidota bacterium]